MQLGTKHMAPPGGATSQRLDCLVLLPLYDGGVHCIGHYTREKKVKFSTHLKGE